MVRLARLLQDGLVGVVLPLVLLVDGAAAYNNGPMAYAPLLGWQTWCAVGPCGTDLCTDEQIRATAIALNTTSGLQAKGYEWLVLDDCWHPSRDPANDTLVPDPERFPYGMPALIAFVHSLNLKFGLYTSVGTTTCHGGWSPGSYGHYDVDAQTFAAWGVDYVKMDWCGDLRTPFGHVEFSRALNATGRPIVLELCRGLYQEEDAWGYAPSVAQVWRAAHDHHDTWSSTLEQVAALENVTAWSGPFGWAYGDMLMTGGQGCGDKTTVNATEPPTHCPGQTEAEYRSEISLYAVLASPLLVGTDVRAMTDLMTSLLLNDDVLAVNQDALAKPAYVTSSCGDKAYVRRLSDGRVAVAVPNFDDDAVKHRGACLDDLGLGGDWGATNVTVRDVWLNTTLEEGAFTEDGEYKRPIDPHDTVFLILELTTDVLEAPPPPPEAAASAEVDHHHHHLAGGRGGGGGGASAAAAS